jgi:hypothetical protein
MAIDSMEPVTILSSDEMFVFLSRRLVDFSRDVDGGPNKRNHTPPKKVCRAEIGEYTSWARGLWGVNQL